jgi:hypothetical protein
LSWVSLAYNINRIISSETIIQIIFHRDDTRAVLQGTSVIETSTSSLEQVFNDAFARFSCYVMLDLESLC